MKLWVKSRYSTSTHRPINEANTPLKSKGGREHSFIKLQAGDLKLY